MNETSTTPSRTLTPKTAMKPTAAEMLKWCLQEQGEDAADEGERDVEHDEDGITVGREGAEGQLVDDRAPGTSCLSSSAPRPPVAPDRVPHSDRRFS
jgi:hypothetical protein